MTIKKMFLLAMWLMPSIIVSSQPKFGLTDKLATKETRMLYSNLKRMSSSNILFGHQHATEYGHGWTDDSNRSDVKSVTGSHPAVIGVDFSGLSGRPDAQIEKQIKLLRENIEATYNRGGITTVSWHFNNPVSGGEFYWKDSVSLPAVRYIIPGGTAHNEYKKILTTIADLAKSVKGNDGKLVPMIFRPYHEFDGEWFWWGKPHCTTEEFKTLWQFTVSYLRDSLGVHNFIYAFSPDNIFTNEAEYLARYPGDNFVDMVGVDNYGDWGRYGKYQVDSGIMKLKIVSDYALKANKVAAFTETGLESIPNTKWYTDVLLKSLQSNNLQLSYVLVWRNDSQSKTHYYAPYPGHISEADFKAFYNSPFTLFENDLRKIYKKKWRK